MSDGLKSVSERKLSVLQLTEMLTFLPGGRPDPDPMGGLTSTRMQHIIEEASSRFDWVILDAPPVGPVADANLLAAMADTVVFVVRAAESRYADVERAIDLLGRERIFGVVLNGLEPGSHDVQDDCAVSRTKGVSMTSRITRAGHRAGCMLAIALALSPSTSSAQQTTPGQLPAHHRSATTSDWRRLQWLSPAPSEMYLSLTTETYGGYDQELQGPPGGSGFGAVRTGAFGETTPD